MRLLSKLLLVSFCAAATLFSADSAPRRIISLSPNTTEILYGVGAFPRVVAVSQYCSYPPEVNKLPRVGGWQTSDAEKIVALRPDLVVLTKAQEPFIADKLQAFSLQSLAVPSDTLADIYLAIEMIGKATGMGEQGVALAKQTRMSLDRIREATKAARKKEVLLVISRTPGSLADMYVATEGSFLVELLSIAGGHSVAAAQKGGYVKLSKEALLTLNPELIIDVQHTTSSKLAESPEEVWKDLPELRAVRDKQIYPLDDEFVVHPSQFVAHTAQVFEHIIHPELAVGVH